MQCGLNASGLCDEEEGLLPPGSNESAYARARNAVLALWRRDVSRRLSEERALHAAAPGSRAYTLAAWRFLDGEPGQAALPSRLAQHVGVAFRSPFHSPHRRRSRNTAPGYLWAPRKPPLHVFLVSTPLTCARLLGCRYGLHQLWGGP